MTEITFNKNIYVYGKFYDVNRVKVPKAEDNWDVIIYAQHLNETNTKICSLEGIFVSDIPFIKKGESVMKDWNPVVRRNQMKELEEKYKGKFIPFEK